MREQRAVAGVDLHERGRRLPTCQILAVDDRLVARGRRLRWEERIVRRHRRAFDLAHGRVDARLGLRVENPLETQYDGEADRADRDRQQQRIGGGDPPLQRREHGLDLLSL